MHKFIINILLLGIVATVSAQTLEDSLTYVRSNKAWPKSDYMKQVVEKERDPVGRSTAKLVYILSLIDARSNESLELANRLSNELQSGASESWQRHFAQFLEVTVFGLRGDFDSQVVAAERALDQINYKSLYASDSEFIKVQMDVFGMSPSRLKDTTNFLLGSAMIKENMLDGLEDVTLRISDRELRKVLENAAETVRIMKSEDRGEPYAKAYPATASENESKLRSSPVVQGEDLPSTKAVGEVPPPQAVIEKPVEVVMPEPSEELADESSQWWLWLVGLMVVVGGLALVVRRKS